MVIDLILGALAVLGFLPLVTGYCAYSYGRSFWGWFALSCVLPLLSFLLLAALLHRREMQPGELLLAEAHAILTEAEAAEAAHWQQVLALTAAPAQPQPS